MTKEDFKKLPLHKQDEFLESGELFNENISVEPSMATIVDCCESTVVVAPEIQQVVAEVNTSTSASSIPEPCDIEQQPAVSTLYADGFNIEDPLELLLLLDDDVREERVHLHQWQKQFIIDFAAGGQSDQSPFQAVVRTCNGSGKDKYIIASCVVWLCMRYKQARGVVTSSSGVQLDNQTCAYIDQLCKAANRKFGFNLWKVNYRYYECQFYDENGKVEAISPIICYATDEAGKAEGYHPLAFAAKMGLFLSEDKTIPDDINIAMNKCTGYTHRVHVSTPGSSLGHFYNICQTAIDRKAIKQISEVGPEDYIQYHVTAYECSHISKAYIKQMKRDLPGGEFGSAFKSQVLAEFGTTDEMVVISHAHVWRAKSLKIDWKQDPHNTAGLDLSDGGAETVLAIRNGNKLLKIIPFRFDNTEDTVSFLDNAFKENGLDHPEAYINSDCIGIGKPILDRMKRMGWSNIRYFDSRHAAREPRTYYRRGDEIWFTFGKLLERGEIMIVNDDLLVTQLVSRYYKILEGKHKLLSKLEQKSRGYPSPDRADTVVYCFSDYQSTFIQSIDGEKDVPFEQPESPKPFSEFTLKGAARGSQQYSYRHKYRVNNNQRDFSELQEQVNENNQRIRERLNK